MVYYFGYYFLMVIFASFSFKGTGAHDPCGANEGIRIDGEGQWRGGENYSKK
jgi:hypothetical protein